jgi:hypothetical protein
MKGSLGRGDRRIFGWHNGQRATALSLSRSVPKDTSLDCWVSGNCDTLDQAVQGGLNEDRTDESFLLMTGQHSTSMAPPCHQFLSFINSATICLVVRENASI